MAAAVEPIVGCNAGMQLLLLLLLARRWLKSLLLIAAAPAQW